MIRELNLTAWHIYEHLPKALDFMKVMETPEPCIKLYLALNHNTFTTDEEAIKGADIGQKTSYRKYGKILLEHLCKLFTFVDVQKLDKDDYSKSRIEDMRKLSQVDYLIGIANRSLASKLAEEVIASSKTFERTELVVMASRMKRHCDFMEGAKIESCAAISKEILQNYAWSQLHFKAQEYSEEANAFYKTNKSYDADYLALMEERAAELKPYVGLIPSYMFHTYYYFLSYKIFDQKGQYLEYVRIGQEGLKYFQSKKFDTGNLVTGTILCLVVGYTRLNQPEQAEKYIQEALLIKSKMVAAEITLLEVSFYFYAQTLQLEKATATYTQAVTARKFKTVLESKAERWVLLGAYLYIGLILNGQDPEAQNIPKFRSSKFLNDLQYLDKDKGAMNASALIAHIIMQILEDKIDIVWERIEALQKYVERYIAGDGNERIKTMFAYLKDFARYAHDKEVLKEKTAYYLDLLESYPYATARQPHEVEVLPYGWLMERLCGRICTPNF